MEIFHRVEGINPDEKKDEEGGLRIQERKEPLNETADEPSGEFPGEPASELSREPADGSSGEAQDGSIG